MTFRLPDELFIIDENDRYARFRLISWWNQEKLLKSKVLVVGAGALGNEVLKNLALIGVGTLVIVDYDTIETSNLTRSVLFRAADRGKSKADKAAQRVRELNPDVTTVPLNADVITDVGLGLIAEMDVVVGCLDNREARLWINRLCWKAKVPWIDGAIQELQGTCKIFVPPDSACYECAMTEMDYKLINVKYSCPLLKREDIMEGKVPTVTTMASFVGALQTQEALKILHGLQVQAGSAIVFNGLANNFYVTRLPRKESCLSHESLGDPLEGKNLSNQNTPEDVFRYFKMATKQSAGCELLLDRELVVRLDCHLCGGTKIVMKVIQRSNVRDAYCDRCHVPMTVKMTHVVKDRSNLASVKLEQLGVPCYDIVRIKADGHVHAVKLGGDREKFLGSSQ